MLNAYVWSVSKIEILTPRYWSFIAYSSYISLKACFRKNYEECSSVAGTHVLPLTTRFTPGKTGGCSLTFVVILH